MVIRQPMAALLSLFLLAAMQVRAHPTGNMITVGDQVLWSYISPVDDPDHHACIMSWREGEAPRVLLRSEFPASDFMLYNRGTIVYILERRYLAVSDTFEVRLLKMSPGQSPDEIWPWFTDRWHMGEAGFVMLSDTRMVFGRYPGIQILEQGQQPTPYFRFGKDIRRIRGLPEDRLLLLGETDCWLVTHEGEVLKEWKSLLDLDAAAPPLGRNQVFDMAYKEGKLLVAYWGNRLFKVLDGNANQRVIRQVDAPFAPHWVAFMEADCLLFSSRLDFTGDPPKPDLVRYAPNGETFTIWGIPE